MRTIESTSNPRIQRARRVLQKRDRAHFLIEGAKLFEEAIRSGIRIEEAYFTEEAFLENRILVGELEAKDVVINRITRRLAKLITDLETPPGLIAMVKRPENHTENVQRLAILLIGLRDPGNVGTIIRSAEGAGCDAVFYSDCADPFQPKVVRATMGSIFRMPVIEIKDATSFLKSKQATEICGLSMEGVPLNQWKPSFPVLVCVGSESHGLPPELPVTRRISIPMEARVESLNAAVAASVCLYWIRLTCRNRS
jgi:RNA methyltransferase, TrmH family